MNDITSALDYILVYTTFKDTVFWRKLIRIMSRRLIPRLLIVKTPKSG